MYRPLHVVGSTIVKRRKDGSLPTLSGAQRGGGPGVRSRTTTRLPFILHTNREASYLHDRPRRRDDAMLCLYWLALEHHTALVTPDPVVR